MQETNKQVLAFQAALAAAAPGAVGGNSKHPYAMTWQCKTCQEVMRWQISSLPAHLILVWQRYCRRHANEEYIHAFSITADGSELQGADFLAFKGFLQQSFRDHDYAVGRLKARQLLRKLAPGQGTSLTIYNSLGADDLDLEKIIDGSPICLQQLTAISFCEDSRAFCKHRTADRAGVDKVLINQFIGHLLQRTCPYRRRRAIVAK